MLQSWCCFSPPPHIGMVTFVAYFMWRRPMKAWRESPLHEEGERHPWIKIWNWALSAELGTGGAWLSRRAFGTFILTWDWEGWGDPGVARRGRVRGAPWGRGRESLGVSGLHWAGAFLDPSRSFVQSQAVVMLPEDPQGPSFGMGINTRQNVVCV